MSSPFEIKLNPDLTNCPLAESKRNQEEVAAGYEPRIFADLVNVMDSDPDEYFQGDYNWYYTGGSVDVAEVDGDFYTFHMTGDKMNVLGEWLFNQILYSLLLN